MKDRILHTLQTLRAHALERGVQASIFYHEEDSRLMRFANSAISLNTSERLIRLEFTAYDGRRRASYEMITDLGKIDEMKQGIDIAAEMVKHAQPLSYDPTLPAFAESFADESACDPALAELSNEARLAYFNRAVAGLESDEIMLSGAFSCGRSAIAQITTRSEHTQYFTFSDAQITVVLAHRALKWEVSAEASAQRATDLDADGLHRDLAFLLKHYQEDPAVQLPLGKYDIVFGPAAIGDLIGIMNWIGPSGGSMKRGMSFLSEEQIGQKVFSDKFTLVDDPSRRETFPFQRDMTGLPREGFPFFEGGVFRAFAWFQDDADEFGAQPTGHTVMHRSIVLRGGEVNVATLEDLVRMPRENDILYIPYLHYMNVVNPTRGVITASSRFGALLLKQDGTVAVPYNVRLTQSLLDLFGDGVAWLSSVEAVNNGSVTYGPRNPTAAVVPAFMRVNGLEISHSNSSY